MVMIEKDVFCLFNRVEHEKILSPHELKTYNLSYSIYKHDTVDILKYARRVSYELCNRPCSHRVSVA